MDSDQALLLAVARLPTVGVDGQYLRQVARSRIERALVGSSRGGRWGPPRMFPVLYLSDDHRSCVAEAYRHTVDPLQEQAGVAPGTAERALLTVDVHVTNVLDLTTATARTALGLDPAIVFSEPQTSRGAAYEECSRIGVAAHRLERHGILVPAATHYGNTLVLFVDHLPPEEVPVLAGEPVIWTSLPPDPRRIRLIRTED